MGMTGDGTLKWLSKDLAAYQMRTCAVDARAGSIWAMCTGSEADYTRTVVRRFDAAGKVLAQRVIGKTKGIGRPAFLIALANGGVAQGGARGSNMWLGVLDAQASPTLDKALPNAGALLGGSVAADGRLWLVGASSSVSANALLMSATATGQLLTARQFDGLGHEELAAIIPAADAGVLAVGSSTAGPRNWSKAHAHGLLIRADAWGRPTCKESGLCANLSPAKCDDKSDCTVDACVPAKGCVHTELALGAACEDGNPCTAADACAKGKCIAGGPTDCDDGKSCTTDSCHLAKGCQHVIEAKTLGKACDDGQVCTGGDRCTKQGCEATATAKMWRKTYDVAGLLDATHAARAADGSIMFVGPVVKGMGWVRVDADGKLLKTGQIKPVTGTSTAMLSAQATMRGVIGRKGGGFVAVGSYTKAGKGVNYAEAFTNEAWEIGADGKFVQRQEWPDTHQIAGVLNSRSGDGSYVVYAVGRYGAGHGLNLRARGGASWSRVHAEKDLGYRIDWAYGDALSDTSLLFTGRLWKVEKERAWAGRYTAHGAGLWTAQYTGLYSCYSAAVRTDGKLLVSCGVHAKSGAEYHWRLLTVDHATGKELGRTAGPANGVHEVRAMYVLADNHVVLGGHRTVNSPTQPFLTALNAAGKVAWTRTYPAATGLQLMRPLGLIPVPGGWYLTAMHNDQGTKRPALLRLGPWGHADCKAAGACVAALAKGCDDGKAATLDYCDAVKGCAAL